MVTKHGLPWWIVLLLGTGLWAGPVFAQRSPDPLTLELLQRIERLETEVRQMRGELEVYRYQLDGLRQQTLMGATAPPRAVAPTPTPDLPPVAPSTSAPAPTPSAPPVASAAEGRAAQADFDIALGELREGRYAQAIADFQRFLDAHPGSSQAGDAQYWLGEAYYLSRDGHAAKEAFIRLGLDYPQSARLPDALLKLGYLYGEQGETVRAREVLQKLIRVYPETPAARLAERRLQSLP